MENPQLAEPLRQLAGDNARCWLMNPLLGRELTPPAVGRLGQIRARTLVLHDRGPDRLAGRVNRLSARST